ncbi:MAG: DUF4253 domain-containing protein [Prevotella sp.]|nr:DUF4253 domain-containing protein [Prevotella sp.]MBP5356324.1 DUF4253 domain-containing protein [Prevotella sp.]
MTIIYLCIGFLFILVIVYVVITIYRDKAEKESHDWHTEDYHVEEQVIRKMQELACCHTTFYDSTDPVRIEEAYKEAVERGEREGFFPVLLVLVDDIKDIILHQFGVKDGKNGIDMEKVQMHRQELMHSTESGKDWLDVRLRELQKGFKTESPDFYRMDVLGEYTSNGIGQTSFSGIINYQTERTYPLLLAEVPVKQPWQILAWFPNGGGSKRPKAEHLVSVAKYWYEKYGAVPAVICDGILEFAVPQPVSEEDSLPLAEEHYAFCTDIVDENLGTINALADVLRKSTVWLFWTD